MAVDGEQKRLHVLFQVGNVWPGNRPSSSTQHRHWHDERDNVH
jgi:hypothetical protein